MKTTTLTITGMRCNGCAQLIQGLLQRVNGVQTCAVSHPDASARVLYDETKVNEVSLHDAIERAGYSAMPRSPK